MEKRYIAGKPFNTANRRYNIGDPVTEEEIRDGDRDFEDLKQRRLIVVEGSRTAEKALERAGDTKADEPSSEMLTVGEAKAATNPPITEEAKIPTPQPDDADKNGGSAAGGRRKG